MAPAPVSTPPPKLPTTEMLPAVAALTPITLFATSEVCVFWIFRERHGEL
jgi:hypothetical protein